MQAAVQPAMTDGSAGFFQPLSFFQAFFPSARQTRALAELKGPFEAVLWWQPNQSGATGMRCIPTGDQPVLSFDPVSFP